MAAACVTQLVAETRELPGCLPRRLGHVTVPASALRDADALVFEEATDPDPVDLARGLNGALTAAA